MMDGSDYTEHASFEAPSMPYGSHDINDGGMTADTSANALTNGPQKEQDISPGEESVLRSDVCTAHATLDPA